MGLFYMCIVFWQQKAGNRISLLSVVWVLLAFISAYVMFAVWGMFSGGSLEELLKTESQAHMYFSLSAGALRFSMGE